MSPDFTGRSRETRLLTDALQSNQSEMIAVVGRRRVGKTHLIRQVFGKQFDFDMTGMQYTATAAQLENFTTKLLEYSGGNYPSKTPESWLQAFAQLQRYLSRKRSQRKKVIFSTNYPGWLPPDRASSKPWDISGITGQHTTR